MNRDRSNSFHAATDIQPILREVGLDGGNIFEHPEIQPWRVLPDRENCTLDARLSDGKSIRWHIKRYAPPRGKILPVDAEVRGHRLLEQAGIPTAPLLAWGNLADGRSFVIFEDLAGYQPADKMIARGTKFELLLHPTSDLAAQVHGAGLHHRDLYLCHFMAKVDGPQVDLKLIDTARVRPLPGMLRRRRWIVKDLAQFWYSTLPLPITDPQRQTWIMHYAQQRGLVSAANLEPPVQRKARQIARHDARLREKQPDRNISISQ